ncbi:MAG: hypothetical protein BWY77_01840 [bacterium ADurb.Bin431]|nr:MAG: hypothetical protein BWY77_01840 [bacterium ADurb.Bin431]
MLTPGQNRIYRPLFKLAWQSHCRLHPELDPADRDAQRLWKETHLRKVAWITSTNDVPTWGRTAFDELCRYFACLSGDPKQIDYWTRTSERVMLWCMDRLLAALDANRNYAAGIAKNMKLIGGEVQTVDDLPAQSIHKICIALNNSCKRKLGVDVWKKNCEMIRAMTADQILDMIRCESATADHEDPVEVAERQAIQAEASGAAPIYEPVCAGSVSDYAPVDEDPLPF